MAQLNNFLKTELICETYIKKQDTASILDVPFLPPSNYYPPKNN